MSFKVRQTDTVAIVGASNNPDKYGHKITADLLSKGYKIFPVNLKESEILGLRAYSHLDKIDEPISIVDIVVPPQVAVMILNDVKKLGLQQVWFQPGSESDEAIEFCQKNGINYNVNSCIMVETSKGST